METPYRNKSREETIHTFKSMEMELNLFNLEISGVKIWQYFRFNILSKILIGTNLQKQAHDIVKNKYLKALFKNVKFVFKNKSLFFKKKMKKDILIFTNSRRRQIDGEYWAIYTDFLLDSSNIDYQCIEIPSMTLPLKPPKIKNTLYLDYSIIAIKTLIERLKRIRISDNEIKELNLITNRIKSKFNVDINIFMEVKRFLILRKAFSWYFNFLLKKFKPKLIVEVVSYSLENMILNELCKRKNIITIEMQHGSINKFHLGYDFPSDNMNLDVFPDYFFSFGKHWSDITTLPIPEEKIIQVGFPYFEEQYKRYISSKNHQKKKILIISQGTIGKEISNFAFNLAKITDHEIIYKLHPGEYVRWKKDYNYLQNNTNITVIDNNDIPLYQLFAESDFLIGVYSTAIYESLPFNLNIFILKLPGYKITEDLVNLGFAKLVTNPKELVDYIKTETSVSEKIDIDYFFKRDSIENQKKAILDILESCS
jgi:hypothetical protein